jgi:TetR/AcrR family transcriptional regulator of autoinduction and epiphytic fitness
MSTPAVPGEPEPIDGRTARAARTRDAIVEACLELIDEGDLRPTAPRIAERAGVSVRSVFQHFDDLEALFSAVGDKVRVRLTPLIAPIDPTVPLAERATALVSQRATVLEEVTPVLRAALVHSAASPVISRQFAGGHAFFRDQVREVFAPELAAATDPDHLETALVALLSWSTWETLRASQGLDPGEASRTLDWMVHAILDGARSDGATARRR